MPKSDQHFRKKVKMYAELTKKCNRCKIEKKLDEFSNDKNSRLGKCRFCRACRSEYRKRDDRLKKTSEYNKLWRAKNLEYAKFRDKKHNLRRNFKMTIEDFEELKKAQSNSCGICFKNRSTMGKDLCVDHDHKTNKIRGLLCDNCNRGMGLLNDSIELLSNAIKYLENSKK